MKYIYIISFVTILISCRKPTNNCLPMSENLTKVCYEQYSISNYDYIWNDLSYDNGVIVGPFYYQFEDFQFSTPVFNPNNNNEIAFIKKHTSNPLNSFELWKFNFCTGQSFLISENCFYGLDWSSNGWLTYTDLNHQINKVKPNGDSLSVISTLSGFNRAGKWNPSGTMFWNWRDDGEYHYINIDGEEIYQSNIFKPYDWLNDSTVMGGSPNLLVNSNLYSMSLPSETITLLNNMWTSSDMKVLDRKNMVCYDNNSYYYIRYSLNGDNVVDTLREMNQSYFYVVGDYNNNKIITTLIRTHWKDSLANEFYFRSNLLIMDPDGTNERLIEIPE